VAARSKGGSTFARLLRLRVRIPPGSWISVYVSDVCCQVEVSASSRSLVQRSPNDYGESECDIEASITRWSWPSGGMLCHGGGEYFGNYYVG